MAEPFQPPFESREERIAHNEAWSRSLNERQAEWLSGRDAMVGFRCECWQEDCAKLIHLSDEDWKVARAEPSRFAVAPGHVAENFEAVIKEFPASGWSRSSVRLGRLPSSWQARGAELDS